jgi:hypothetical protein
MIQAGESWRGGAAETVAILAEGSARSNRAGSATGQTTQRDTPNIILAFEIKCTVTVVLE